MQLVIGRRALIAYLLSTQQATVHTIHEAGDSTAFSFIKNDHSSQSFPAFSTALSATESSVETESIVNPSLRLKQITRRQHQGHEQYLSHWAATVRRFTSQHLTEPLNDSSSSSPLSTVTAGALIRLAFHDAVTTSQPNNASIRYELQWSENRALAQPLQLVQWIHEQAHQEMLARQQEQEQAAAQNSLAATSPSGSSSLADTIALVAAQAIQDCGGPHIPLRLGRIDQDHADAYYLPTPLQAQTDRSRVTQTMPDAGLDSDGLRLYFQRLGLQEMEWVALCGIHGMGRHVSLLGMDKECLRNLTRTCLENAPVLLPFVSSSTGRFSNDYFEALLRWNERQVELGEVAFLPTDVALVVDAGLRRHVRALARDPDLYATTVRRAFQKLMEGTTVTKPPLTMDRY